MPKRSNEDTMQSQSSSDRRTSRDCQKCKLAKESRNNSPSQIHTATSLVSPDGTERSAIAYVGGAEVFDVDGVGEFDNDSVESLDGKCVNGFDCDGIKEPDNDGVEELNIIDAANVDNCVAKAFFGDAGIETLGSGVASGIDDDIVGKYSSADVEAFVDNGGTGFDKEEWNTPMLFDPWWDELNIGKLCWLGLPWMQ